MKKIMLIPYVASGSEILFFVGKRPQNLIPEYVSTKSLWQFPTGKIGDNHPDEKVVEGALRELSEELGATKYKNFINNGYIFNWNKGSQEVKEYIFAVELVDKNIDLLEEEFEDFVFAKYEDARKLLFFDSHKEYLDKTYDDIKTENYSKIFVFCGPSGSGKETILSKIIERTGLERAKTVTSRAKKPNEKGDGRIFVSKLEFEKMQSEERFMETNFFAGNYYGSLKSEITSRIENGSSILIELDLNGLESIRKFFSNTVSIFIKVELEDLEKRIKDRGRESESEIKKRLAISKKELEKSSMCDFVVENKNGMLENAVDKIVEIIQK